MKAKIRKFGNSQGVIFSKSTMLEAGLQIEDEVNIKVVGEKIEITPSNHIRGKYHINDLVSQMPKDYNVSELSTGSPTGNEVW